MKRFWMIAAAGVAMGFGTWGFAAEPSFRGLGYLFGGDTRAIGVSADGSVVVGTGGTSNVTEAFRWTLSGGMQPLGDAPGGFHHSDGIAVSGDGSVIAGDAEPGQTPIAAIWDQIGLQLLPNLRADRESLVYAMSRDGRYVIGQGSIDTQSGNTYPLRWTVGGGVESLGLLPGGTYGEAYAVSGDGSAVVGVSFTTVDVKSPRAFLWTEQAGTKRLLPDDTLDSEAFGISADGSFVVGVSGHGDPDLEGFLFHDGVLTRLGYLDPQYPNSVAVGISDDGRRIIGRSHVGSPYTSEPFIWDAVHGMRDLNHALPDEFGLNLARWHLETVSAISGDGSTLVGWGTDPLGFEQAWVATIPVPEPSGYLLGIGAMVLLIGRRRLFS